MRPLLSFCRLMPALLLVVLRVAMVSLLKNGMRTTCRVMPKRQFMCPLFEGVGAARRLHPGLPMAWESLAEAL